MINISFSFTICSKVVLFYLFRMASKLYNETLAELSSEECKMTTLQSTIYNINVAMYLTNGVCDIARGSDKPQFF